MNQLPDKGEELSIQDVINLCHDHGKHILAKFIIAFPPDLPFKSDGVSGLQTDIIMGVNLYPAAFWHDVEYWCGLPKDKISRLLADYRFGISIIEDCGGTVEISRACFDAVRVGGAESLPTPWHWGFGRKKK